MPRQARLDVPGTLHHVIVRGIEKRNIVKDNKDRENFVRRMGSLAIETETPIYAWALLNNHAHILLRSGPPGLSRYMKRFLTGYAIYFNHSHRRHGHLFQNRFKSIVVEEDSYFQELVRYIHLNPLRAKIIDSFSNLARYRWCGHSVILGERKNDWQDKNFVLSWFGKTHLESKRAYLQFVQKGIEKGYRPDLVGGGLIRSQGGWMAVEEMRRQGVREKSDERILGSGDFVEQLIEESDEIRKAHFPGDDVFIKAQKYIKKVCKDEGVEIQALKAGSRRKKISKTRAKLIDKLIDEFGLTLTETGRQLGVSPSAVSKNLSRRDISGN